MRAASWTAIATALWGCSADASRFVEFPADPTAQAAVIGVSAGNEERYYAVDLASSKFAPIIEEVDGDGGARIVVRPYRVSLLDLGIRAGLLPSGPGNLIPASVLDDQIRFVSLDQDSGWMSGEAGSSFDAFRSLALPERRCREFRADRVVDLTEWGTIEAVAPLAGESFVVLQQGRLNRVDRDGEVEPLSVTVPSLSDLVPTAMAANEEAIWLLGPEPECVITRLKPGEIPGEFARHPLPPGERCTNLTLLEPDASAKLILDTSVGLYRLVETSTGVAWQPLPEPGVQGPLDFEPIGGDRLVVVGPREQQTAVLYEGAARRTEPLPLPEVLEHYARSTLAATMIGTVLAYNSLFRVDFAVRSALGEWTIPGSVDTNPLYALARFGDGFVGGGEFGVMLQYDPALGFCPPQDAVVGFVVRSIVPLGDDGFAMFGQNSGQQTHQLAIVHAYEAR